MTVSTVERGTFDDFLPLRARVTPLVSVYLDAIEGGRVEQVLVEDGAMVQEGQLLAVLSNSDLQLNLLARQADVSRELNSMRSQELALSQTRLANERALIEARLTAEKAERQYNLQKPRRPTSGGRRASSPSFAPPTRPWPTASRSLARRWTR